MKLTNEEIYYLSNTLLPMFSNLDIHIPAKANFFIQKNLTALAAAAAEIEVSRMEVAKHYGTLAEDGQRYEFSDENITIANEELKELFAIEQEIDIHKISINDLGNVEFTPAQMQALMFMIEG